VTEPGDAARQDAQLSAEVIRRLNDRFGLATEEQLIEVAVAILTVGPVKRRRILSALLIATAQHRSGQKAGESAAYADLAHDDSFVLKSMFCQHDFLVGKCPLC
jgi:hypothetical protein